MTEQPNRRHFLGAGLATGAALLSASARADGPADQLTVGIMGTGSRGTSLATLFAQQPAVTVKYVCDVDKKRAADAAGAVNKAVGKTPMDVQNFRRILDDKAVDILVVATCNHWHAPAAILGCAAGKHVYVEKPCSHNPQEGEWLVAAATRQKKHVQMGNQRRSWPKIAEAMKRLRDGVIGRVYLAEAWYTADRKSIGRGKDAPVPAGLDYNLWQGPAPRKPFKTNYLPYTWHWFWHWGNGELGNNGIHTIDLCRWGLGVDYPIRVTSSGGRYRYEDDQETPDTHLVGFEFANRKSIVWHGLSCNQLPAGKTAEVVFLGENGSLMLNDKDHGYSVHDPKGKEIERVTGPGSDAMHIGNFLDSIRAGQPLNSEIGEGHKSTVLCHLGNIAHRTGRALKCEGTTGHILGDKDAIALWSREYEKGWEPKV
jgi:predicted dehydrogenase